MNSAAAEPARLEGRNLTLTHVGSKARGTVTAVQQADICLSPGERLALIGRSGSGKSSLLKMLLARESATSGEVRYAGQMITPGPVSTLRSFRQRVQYMPQEPAASLDPRLTVRHLVAIPLKRLQVPGEHAEIAEQALRRVHLGPEFLERRRAEISGGQAQRVAIARAIATGCEILLADEPVSGLDLPLRDEVLQLLRELSEERNLGVLLITHDLDAARQICEHAMVMADGRIVESGLMQQLFSDPESTETQRLVHAVPRISSDLLEASSPVTSKAHG